MRDILLLQSQTLAIAVRIMQW